MNMIKVQFRGLDSVKNFVNILSKFECDFDIVDKRYVIDAKSIMGIFSLDLLQPITLTADTEYNKAFEDDMREFMV